eukprot:CAMPEP_0202442734 /NCGR_PEP_ID=MMETSP1360-20130828/2109_1 /ASSEMBLY_ACC=CAM_ASM_000848 /TAXON_ID=515479 /ORGANISM="Licmophora paradoxa, Strain CCMP2313" /LENGTH=341 /DNA_ID=CAMNT_0049058177 /DNA_START=55 /DNA_END=1080 /DNA_ORIENTATION=+
MLQTTTFTTSSTMFMSNVHDSTKQKVNHDYIDYANVTPDASMSSLSSIISSSPISQQGKRPRGGVAVPFPCKLHSMLNAVSQEGLDHIVSWQPHGRCFLVHKPQMFVENIMPRFFNQHKMTSFQRQLNLYGFKRITSGKDRSSYYHPLFLRSKDFLVDKIYRTKVKGIGTKFQPNPEHEPNFYSMPFLHEQPQQRAEIVSETETEQEQEDRLPTTTTTAHHSHPRPYKRTSQNHHQHHHQASPNISAPSTSSIHPVREIDTSRSNVVSPLHEPKIMSTDILNMLPPSLDLDDDALYYEGMKFHFLEPTELEQNIQLAMEEAVDLGESRSNYQNISNILLEC